MISCDWHALYASLTELSVNLHTHLQLITSEHATVLDQMHKQSTGLEQYIPDRRSAEVLRRVLKSLTANSQ